MKVKVLVKSGRPQNQLLTIGKSYDVIDEFTTWDDKLVTVISNDVGDDTDLYYGEFEDVTE